MCFGGWIVVCILILNFLCFDCVCGEFVVYVFVIVCGCLMGYC